MCPVESNGVQWKAKVDVALKEIARLESEKALGSLSGFTEIK